MTHIFATNDVGIGSYVMLPAESALVLPNVTVGSVDTTAIVGGNSGNYVYVQGTVMAAAAAVQLGDNAAADNSEHLLVDTTGSIAGMDSGVTLLAFGSSIDNRGRIWSSLAGIYSMSNNVATTSTVINTGTIEGGTYGVSRFGSEDLVVHNSGLIKGGTYAFKNTGAGDMVVDNTGAMTGTVLFGDGDDLYDGHAGRHSSSDSINGGGGNDTLIGGIDPDTLVGLGDRDILNGNGGADVLDGGLGADHMFGGLGNDFYRVDDAADVVSEAGGGGIDTVESFISLSFSDKARVIGAVENLTLMGLATNGTGNALANALAGNVLSNTLSGLAGNDRLDGQGGIDRLLGGLGNDRLTGGAGGDLFVFGTTLNASINRDVITDFVHSVDKIQLGHAVFAALGGVGALHANFFHQGTAAADADDHIIYNQTNGYLYYDSNGNLAGGSTLFAVLAHAPSLTALDFQVI